MKRLGGGETCRTFTTWKRHGQGPEEEGSSTHGMGSERGVGEREGEHAADIHRWAQQSVTIPLSRPVTMPVPSSSSRDPKLRVGGSLELATSAATVPWPAWGRRRGEEKQLNRSEACPMALPWLIDKGGAVDDPLLGFPLVVRGCRGGRGGRTRVQWRPGAASLIGRDHELKERQLPLLVKADGRCLGACKLLCFQSDCFLLPEPGSRGGAF